MSLKTKIMGICTKEPIEDWTDCEQEKKEEAKPECGKPCENLDTACTECLEGFRAWKKKSKKVLIYESKRLS